MVLKKLVRSAITLAALLAGFLAYAQGFAIVRHWVPDLERAPLATSSPIETETERQRIARDLVRETCGPEHWAVKAQYVYDESNRGYLIYFNDYYREDNGKRLTLRPFLLIWRGRPGGSTSTISGDSAVIDFNAPPNLVHGEEESRVVYASIERNVLIRDDKGTHSDLADDLVIGPLTSLEYREEFDTITSDSPVVIRDRDTVATSSSGVKIELRRQKNPKGSAKGTAQYEGARSLRLIGRVEIDSRDVGRSGLVPGGATVSQTTNQPRPAEIVCDEDLLVEFPPPFSSDDSSDPSQTAPEPDPTFATFFKNVRIRQGDAQNPEQIDCDRLHLTLVPAETANRTVASRHGGPVSDLTLKKAVATGHAVWLQSQARGVTGYGQQLIHERRAPDAPDFTYFKGDRYTLVKRLNKKEDTTDEVRSYDVSIYQPAPDENGAKPPLTIESGGPGRLVTRRNTDKSIVRTATWNLILRMQPVQDDPRRRQLTLEGSPSVEDLERGRCTASQKIVATLVEDDPPPLADASVQPTTFRPDSPPSATPDSPKEGKLRVELIRAWRDVNLITGGKSASEPNPTDGAMPDRDAPKTIHAREKLVAVFEKPQPPKSAPQPAPTPAAAPEPPPKKPEPKPSEPEPPLLVEANQIWAWLEATPKADSPADPADDKAANNDLKEARLRGQVVVHQDPKPGKPKGMDVRGDQVDLLRQVVPDPSAPGTETRLFEIRAYGEPNHFAYVGSDSFSIEGRALGMNQAKNYAVVMGPGRLIQEKAGGEVLGDTPPEGQKPAEPEDPMKPRGPLTITWGLDDDGRIIPASPGEPSETWMQFYGKPLDENGQPTVAKAFFSDHVHAWTDESQLHCARMIAYLDREIDFRKSIKKPKPADNADPNQKEPVARVTNVVCEENVDISSVKRTETGEIRQRQRILGELVTYNKITNEFHVETPGNVYLYDRRKAETPPNAAQARAGMKPAPEPLGPLELTRIDFDRRMDGQLNSRRPGEKNMRGVAEFFGNVRTIRAQVPDENADLDADRPPREFVYTVSETVRVRSEPPPPGASGPDKENDRVLLEAWGNIFARSGRQDGSETSIRADDHMVYDSLTGLSIIYGGPGGVLMVDQDSPGGVPSSGVSSVVKYNHKTGQHQAIDARQLNIINPDSGKRTEYAGAPEEKRKKTKREMFPRVKLNNKNRRGFTGQ